jgi:hypothetical protein
MIVKEYIEQFYRLNIRVGHREREMKRKLPDTSMA